MHAADDDPPCPPSPDPGRRKSGGHRVHRGPGELDHLSPGRGDRAIEELHHRALIPMSISVQSRLVALSWAIFLAPALPGAAGDWPQWRGPDRADVSTETALLEEWPAGGPR